MEEFKQAYLGSLLLAKSFQRKDVGVRNAMAKASLNQMRTVLTGGLKQKLKKRLARALVWNVVVYTDKKREVVRKRGYCKTGDIKKVCLNKAKAI